MIRTNVTRTLALAGFLPAGKLSNLISRICLRVATLALASAGMLAPALLPAPSAQAQTFKLLYTFTGGADGAYPQYGGLIADSSGNLYGVTAFGGNQEGFSGSGVVFKLVPAGNETVLYTFTGGADGAQPQGGLVMDTAGNLYGTTVDGGIQPGAFGSGVIFELDPAGSETVLLTFDYIDGANSYAPLLRDAAGNLYGATFSGGHFGDGAVFELGATGSEKVRYAFSGPADGANPVGGLIGDSAGNLYGTTEYGGDLNGCSGKGCGVVFKLAPGGQETVLYLFTGGADGANPYARLNRDAAGNLYGTTWNGGATGNGTVFKVDAAGQETVLYSFTGGTDGANPPAGVIQDAAGNLYGTTNHAGGACFCGTVFKLDTAGNFTVLHTFDGGDGQYPGAPLLLHGGVLYGTASGGGPHAGAGTIFKITLP